MDLRLVLLGILALFLLVLVGSFLVGDARRRAASGVTGPRPVPSVGEALRQVALHPTGRVLLLILGEEPESREAARALAEDPGVVSALSTGSLRHVLLARGADGPEVAAHLYEKYAGDALPPGPRVLLLDREGLPIATTDLARGPLPTWFPGWLESQPVVGTPVRHDRTVKEG